MSQRLRLIFVGVLCICGAIWLSSRRHPPAPSPTAAQPHFFARYVVLYGEEGHREPLDVEGIVLSPDGRLVGAGVRSPDPMLQLGPQFWEVATHKILPIPRAGYLWFDYGEQSGAHQTRTGLVGVLEDGCFALRNIGTGRIVRRFSEPTKDHCVTWTLSADGKSVWWADEQQRIFWRSIR